MKLFAAALLLCVVCACVSSHPDRYYILTSRPSGTVQSHAAPTVRARLRVSLPSLVDRAEMVVNSGADGVLVLEHERWGAPLADMVTQTVARDIELRRADLLVSVQGDGLASSPTLNITLNLIQVSMFRGDKASIEAQWRIFDPRSGKESLGADVFSAPLAADDYSSVARTLGDILGLLADRLAAQINN